jgi:MFS family permease
MADSLPHGSIQPAEHHRAIRYLLVARGLRDFGDGFVVVLLPAYLIALGITPLQVGIIATAALLGSALLTLVVGMLGSRYDHRRLLLASALLMAASGMAFAAIDAYALLLVVACVGIINPSGGNVSMFVPLEHAVLARDVAASKRTLVFARYGLVGAFAGSVGALVAATPDLLAALGLAQLAAIKLMFVLYALLGIFAAYAYSRIPPHPAPATSRPTAALGPSRHIVYRLAALFCIDAFAGGFVVQSLLALWLFERFDMSLSAASLFFSSSGLLAAFSYPVAAWLSRRIGLVNTMAYTHVPSSLCLILAAFSQSLQLTLVLLLIRAALGQMDVPTRASYVMAVVAEAERPAAASFTSVPRSLASAISPALAGAMFSASLQAWPLVICGTLKIVYDVLLLLEFRHVKPPEEQ